MKTVLITSQKGGCGKTTTAAHLAVEIERAGDGPVVIVDADPQGTLSMWRNKRKAESPRATTPPSLAGLREHLARVERAGIAYAIIDSPPARGPENDALLQTADFVLIPIKASPADIWAIGPTLQAVTAAGKPFAFLLNGVKANTRITAQAAALLSKHGQVLDAFLGDRVDYAAALTDGRTAPEIAPSGNAAREIAALWDALKGLTNEKTI
jgi:chromosome partitioning protein